MMGFCLEFFGLKNQIRGHVLSYMSLNELSVVIVIIILLIFNLFFLLKIFRRRKISKLNRTAYLPIKILTIKALKFDEKS
jgi:hypothetical protein